MTFQIETRRLIIRDVREDDIPILVEQFAEAESRENILSFQADETYNRNELEKAMAWAKQAYRPYYKLAVELKGGGAVIGSCNLSDAVPQGSDTFLGWHYGHRFRGNGYATETAFTMLDFAFEFVRVNVVYADCFAENRASIRVMKKIGMKESWNFDLFNMFRGWSYGEDKPAVRYFLTGEQWRARH